MYLLNAFYCYSSFVQICNLKHPGQIPIDVLEAVIFSFFLSFQCSLLSFVHLCLCSTPPTPGNSNYYLVKFLSLQNISGA